MYLTSPLIPSSGHACFLFLIPPFIPSLFFFPFSYFLSSFRLCLQPFRGLHPPKPITDIAYPRISTEFINIPLISAVLEIPPISAKFIDFPYFHSINFLFLLNLRFFRSE